MGDNIQLLDCTLRDGGQGLEYLSIKGIDTEVFDEGNRKYIAESMAKANIDIIELGCMVESEKDTLEFAIYQNVEEMSSIKPQRNHKEQFFVGLYIGPDTDLDKIPEHDENMIDGIRVILRYSELQKSLDYCRGLARKGYKTFIQPMLTMRYTDEELQLLCDVANDIDAYALYIVDSFGYMQSEDIKRIYDFYNERLKKDIRIGFHAHNNMQMAFENVKCFLGMSSGIRRIIIDSCAMGMGQGAGNMQTELLVPYLNEKYGKDYQLKEVLDVCDELSKFRSADMYTWGYSPMRALSALHKAAYKYAVSMRVDKGMTLAEMNEAFEIMPEDFKQRYTPENLEKVIELMKNDGKYKEVNN